MIMGVMEEDLDLSPLDAPPQKGFAATSLRTWRDRKP